MPSEVDDDEDRDTTRYFGPIAAGMRFIWEPDKWRARQKVEVIRVVLLHDREARIWTRNEKGKETWNEEGRFREACILADADSLTPNANKRIGAS